MKLDDSLQSLRIEDILERHATREKRKNPCPVGRRFVTERARRIEYGLSVTNQSMDTTAVESQNTTQESVEESWLAVDNTISRRNRMELLKKRRSLTRKMAISMGGNFNQFTMPVPKFNPQIQYLPSCSEDSDEEEDVKDNVSLEVVDGRKGRPGQGCSTPKRGNNTLGMLKHIDVSAVSFNSTAPQVVVQPLPVAADGANRFVEMMEVDETVKEDDTLDAFRLKGVQAPIVQTVNNGTYTITDGATDTTPVPGQRTFVVERKDVKTSAGTYTVHKDEDTFAMKDRALDKPVKNQRPTKPTESLSSALDKALSQRPTLFREMVGSKNLSEEVASVVNAPKLSILASGGRKSNFNKRQSVQFATELVSPASVSFGYTSTRTVKNPRFVPVTPTRNELASKPTKVFPALENTDDHNKSIGKTDTSTILETTPKRTPSARRSMILHTETLDRIQSPITAVQSGPRYAQHTVASFAKSPAAKDGGMCHHFKSFNDSSKDSSGISTFIECDPNQIMVDATLRSGYRPRAQARFAVHEKLMQLNSDMGNDNEAKAALEEKRKNFLERRLNGTRNEEKTVETVENMENVEKQEQSVTVDILSEVPLTLASIREEKDNEAQEEPASERSLQIEQEATPARAALLKRVSEFGELPDSYGNANVGSPNSTKDEGIVIRQSKKPVEFDSIYSPNATAAPEEQYMRHRPIPNHENSIVEDDTGYGVEMILKPRKIIRPVTPEDEGLRRSKRNRMAPVRRWMGEQPVYKSSPNGSKRLVGSNKIVVKDPRYVHARTTDPIKALDRERKFK